MLGGARAVHGEPSLLLRHLRPGHVHRLGLVVRAHGRVVSVERRVLQWLLRARYMQCAAAVEHGQLRGGGRAVREARGLLRGLLHADGLRRSSDDGRRRRRYQLRRDERVLPLGLRLLLAVVRDDGLVGRVPVAR